jgi:iron complex transport system substrate-binding protein
MIRGLLLSLFLLNILQSCTNQPESKTEREPSEFRRIQFKYVSALELWESDDSLKIIVKLPHSDEKSHTIFAKKEVGSLVCLSTTHVGYLESLSSLSKIKALSNANLIYSENLNSMITAGGILDLGGDQQIDPEYLLNLDPDHILFYDFDPGTSNLISKMESLNLSVIRIHEFMETTPLGKAEWIKFFGVLLDKKSEADSVFTFIEEAYLDLLNTQLSEEKPGVIFGLPWKGTWHQPGGSSFQSQFIKDAGGRYLWENDTSSNALVLDREVILDKGVDADIWLHLNNETSLRGVIEINPAFKSFESVKNNRVYNNNARLNVNMGNDYWESGIVNPHIILKDLMAIIYPKRFPEHELVYYRKLEHD